ncbi:MAG TPA: hypothetical protein VJ690_08410 [Burkholderiales bacterium]|nr:hypothetical protein [Burkholderiales bacterium]
MEPFHDQAGGRGRARPGRARKWDTREEIRAQLRERARQTNQSLLRLLAQVR